MLKTGVTYLRLLFLLGVWVMVFSLFISSILPFVKTSIYFPIQTISFWAGLVMIGSLLGRIGLEFKN